MSTMSKQYFRTPENTLIFQYTVSLLKEINGNIQRSDTDVIISIKETLIDQKPCFKASYIDASLIKGEPFSAAWLVNLKSFDYGQPVTEYLGGPVVYYFNQEQMLDAVIHSFTNDKRLKSQMSEVGSRKSDL